MTKEEFSDFMVKQIASLDSFTVNVKVTQDGEEIDLFSMNAVAIGDGAQLAAETEITGGFKGAMIAAYILHKAEQIAKGMAKDEVNRSTGKTHEGDTDGH